MTHDPELDRRMREVEADPQSEKPRNESEASVVLEIALEKMALLRASAEADSSTQIRTPHT